MELMLIGQLHEKSAMFVTVGISWIKVSSFNQMSAIEVMIHNDVYEPWWYCYFKH